MGASASSLESSGDCSVNEWDYRGAKESYFSALRKYTTDTDKRRVLIKLADIATSAHDYVAIKQCFGTAFTISIHESDVENILCLLCACILTNDYTGAERARNMLTNVYATDAQLKIADVIEAVKEGSGEHFMSCIEGFPEAHQKLVGLLLCIKMKITNPNHDVQNACISDKFSST